MPTVDLEDYSNNGLMDKEKQLEDDIKEITKLPEQIEYDYEGIDLKNLLK